MTKKILAIAIGLSLASTAAATAQEEDNQPIDLTPVPADQVVGPFKLDDGTYVVGTSSSYVVSLTEEGVTLLLTRRSSGTGEFSITGGEITGTWSSTSTGGLSFPGFPDLARADSTGSASGSFSGSFPYSMTGLYDSSVVATVNSALGTTTDSNSSSDEATFDLEHTIQVCDQVQANWTRSFRDQIVANGLTDVTVRTQLAAFGAANGNEFGERVTDLLARANEAMRTASDPDVALITMVDVLLDAEKLMSDMESFPETCSPQPEFLRVINQMLADFVNSLLERWSNDSDGVSMIVLRKLVEVSLRAGLIGAGAADPATAQYLEGRITGLLQARFDSFQDPTAADYDLDELRRTLVVANMLGYELTPNVSTEDLCLALGGC